MIVSLLKKILPTKSDKKVKQYRKVVSKIDSLEANFVEKSDQELIDFTAELKSRYKVNNSIEAILPEAFACAREAGKRFLHMRHYPEQMIAAMALIDGQIAQMATGEGKTLAATLALYVHCLMGKSTYVITVNDYLAKGMLTGCAHYLRDWVYLLVLSLPTWICQKEKSVLL